MNFFTSEYKHQLDAKNRLRIPPKLKEELGSKFYFAQGTNNCLFVFPEATLESICNKISETVGLSDLEKQRGARAFFKSIISLEEDNQGRIVLPANLKKFAKIDKDIVITGAGTRVEIWAKEEYEKYFGDSDDESYDASFGKLGI